MKAAAPLWYLELAAKEERSRVEGLGFRVEGLGFRDLLCSEAGWKGKNRVPDGAREDSDAG